MSTEAHKVIVRRFVEEVQNRGQLMALDELAAPGYVNHSAPPGVPADREGVKQLTALFRQAFPDGWMTIEEMVAEGDRVATRKLFRATHRGELMGIPPTGRAVAIGLIDIVRLVDGKVVESWHAADDLGLLLQLGALPPGHPAQRAGRQAADRVLGTPVVPTGPTGRGTTVVGSGGSGGGPGGPGTGYSGSVSGGGTGAWGWAPAARAAEGEWWDRVPLAAHVHADDASPHPPPTMPCAARPAKTVPQREPGPHSGVTVPTGWPRPGPLPSPFP